MPSSAVTLTRAGGLESLIRVKQRMSDGPRDLYALYLQHGLAERAKAFRATCRTQMTYDIDYYFKMVDESPGTYRRE